MDKNVQAKIEQAAQAEHGWKAEEVRVDEVEDLRRGACSFYEVGHKVKPLSYQASYALLPDGAVAGIGQKDAAARILDACGQDAPAGWWAEILTRFHPELGAGAVLHSEQDDAAVVRKMKEAGKGFAAPALSSEGGARTLSFYLMEYEAYILYHVTATRRGDGTLEVSKVEAF